MIASRSYDKWLLIATLILLVLGALMVFSSTSVVPPAMAKKHVSEFYYLQKHLVTMAIGFVAMLFAFKIDRAILQKASLPLLVLSLALLLLVFMPGMGITAGGARRWLRLWPSTFQPSELVKLSMVMFMAWFLSSESCRADREGNLDKKNSFVFFLFPLFVMAGFQGIFLLQPDFGAAATLGTLVMGLLFISGMRITYLAGTLALVLPAVGYLLMEPYRLRRLVVFLDPWEHRYEGGFQLVQSFLAFGSGGLTGMGLGKSMQKLDFLPEVHTDFIFSMVGEELGFIMAIFVVALFGFIFYRGIMIATRAEDEFAFYLTFGLSMMIALQAVVNFAVVTGLLPTKGLPLPFLSYGGSALLINMTAVGILLNYSKAATTAVSQDNKRRAALDERIHLKKAKRAVHGARV
jgi:cell division protein FtsW